MARSPEGGTTMLTFYYNAGPNPTKVALLLEELGEPYNAVPVDMRKGDQFKADYLAINPNGKVPALTDGDVVVFDSNAILLYLADKYGRFGGPGTPQARGQLLSWLMFVASGVGPYSGQSVHFKHFAPEQIPYAINRYDFEGERHFAILDKHLATRTWMLGDDYSIVDMCVWGWARMLPRVLDAQAWDKFPNLKRLVDGIAGRPAAARALALHARHAFQTEMDDKARAVMFPQNERLKAG
jgi:GST-like protein